MTDRNSRGAGGPGRRQVLECMTWAGTGILWTVAGGVPSSLGIIGEAEAQAARGLTFMQISDSHVGFDKPANPNVSGTLEEAIGKINALPAKPSFDAEACAPVWSNDPESPEAETLRRLDGQAVERLIDDLPEPFRETLVLREVNDLDYREIAAVVGVPVGTVMSRLARARALLRQAWLARGKEDRP